MQAAADELARFVRKEIAFQKADRDERDRCVGAAYAPFPELEKLAR